MRHGDILAVLSLVFARTTTAFWPFQEKRYTVEGLVNAGQLGLGNVTGRVVALGDWNGDQKLDLFTLSEDRKNVQIYLWNSKVYRYEPSHSLILSSPISNIVPGDFNHDGKLDMLVMTELESGGWWGGKSESIGMQVYTGNLDGSINAEAWTMPHSGTAQPVIYDADGSLRPSLLGWHLPETGVESVLTSWTNNGEQLFMQAPNLVNPEKACQLASPHSSAYIDIDGDCLPDLVLHCALPRSSHRYIQVWLNKGSEGYVLSRSYDLPKGSGALSFADIDRDGTMDIVFPTCARHATSGKGVDCSIDIAYNRQVPVCTSEWPTYEKDGSLKCRGWGELCVVDASFEFSFDNTNELFTKVPFTELFPGHNPDLLLHPSSSSHVPLAIQIGDYDLDGYPDLLVTVVNDTARPGSGGPFGSSRSRGTQVKVLKNIPCGTGIAGCDEKGKGKRGFVSMDGTGWEALSDVWDAEGASWIDLDDDGSLDIMIQRSGEQDGTRVVFIKNNFYHDAFFLKAQFLNGACDGDCRSVDGSTKYSPLGVSYSGATYKFTVLDTLGRRVAQQASQLPQTGYHALGMPYSFIGLGRTNNYVEKLHIGGSLHPPGHTTTLESLIPNSQVIINPPSPNTTNGEPSTRVWRTELFLKPGEWIPWVGASVVGTVMVLVIVVVGLNEKEKREDEVERRRALHAINFQAL